ncbi:hypothetical protein CLF_107677 [Clonorchis sinensis]|uniref:Uncharacterized protein n=1 Tax=Clonorchis sinensis TaxID=79923 RepID=G7YH10_CLOSI|nr:hypothetical protein CLF_107677 [Clonorchis sinensis]
MRRSGAAHSVAWKHQKREIQLGSRHQSSDKSKVLDKWPNMGNNPSPADEDDSRLPSTYSAISVTDDCDVRGSKMPCVWLGTTRNSRITSPIALFVSRWETADGLRGNNPCPADEDDSRLPSTYSAISVTDDCNSCGDKMPCVWLCTTGNSRITGPMTVSAKKSETGNRERTYWEFHRQDVAQNATSHRPRSSFVHRISSSGRDGNSGQLIRLNQVCCYSTVSQLLRYSAPQSARPTTEKLCPHDRTCVKFGSTVDLARVIEAEQRRLSRFERHPKCQITPSYIATLCFDFKRSAKSDLPEW